MMNKTTAQVVEPDRVRKTVRQAVSITISEVLCELLQNSRKAGAKTVRIDPLASGLGFTFVDDGSGLSGLEGFQALLRMGESAFGSVSEKNQAPMGVGFHSLLALEGVRTVRIESKALALAIDANRWWNDLRYAQGWPPRLEATSVRAGLSLTVECSADLAVETFHRLSGPQSPTRGLEGWLQVFVSGAPVDVSLPDWAKCPELFSTEYLGNRLTVGSIPFAGAGMGCVNWHGCPIPVPYRHPLAGLFWRLDVKSGVPVDVQTPVRTALVANAKLDQLVVFVEAAVAAWIADPGNADRVTPRILRAWFNVHSPGRRDRTPYWLLWPAGIGTLEEAGRHWAHNDSRNAPDPVVVPKSDSVFIVGTDLQIVDQDGTVEDSPFGVVSFLKMAKDRFGEIWVADEPEDSARSIWWRPGSLLAQDCESWPDGSAVALARGEWGVGTSEDPPSEWFPVTEDVFAFNQTSDDSPQHVHWKFGVLSGDELAGAFLEYASAAYLPDLDANEHAKLDYDQAAVRLGARLAGCLPRKFNFEDVVALLGDLPNSIRFEYEEGAKTPSALLAEGRNGFKKRLPVFLF